MFREDDGMLGNQMGCRMKGLNVKKHNEKEKTVEWRKTWREREREERKRGRMSRALEKLILLSVLLLHK